MIASPSLTFISEFFPSILSVFDSSAFITGFLTAGCVTSCLFALGIYRRTSALLLWYILASLYNRNNLTENPMLPFLGWLSLACVLIPPGETFPLRRDSVKKSSWQLPSPIYWSAWIVLSLSYLYSGIRKFLSPSWAAGEALDLIFQSPISTPWADTMRALIPSLMLKFITCITVYLQMGFIILSLFGPWGRLIAWSSLLAIHLTVLVTLDLRQVTLGMLVVHAFLFDVRWLSLFRGKVASNVFHQDRLAE
jgi:hypothetical protein